MPDCQDYHGGDFCRGRDLEFEDEEGGGFGRAERLQTEGEESLEL